MTVSFARPWVLAGLGFLMAVCTSRAIAQPKPGTRSPTPVPIKVERLDGWTAEGTTALPAVQLKTEFGTSDVVTAKVRSLTLRAEDGVVTATVELDDRSRLTGELLTERIPLRVGDNAFDLKTADLREVKFPKPGATTLWAIVFGLLTLAVMEIVLGVDNVIFLVIVAGKLPEAQRPKARKIGLVLALGTRLLLLFFLSWLIGLTRPLFTLPKLPFFESPDARDVSVRDLILFGGGLFLIWKSVKEMHEKVEASRAGHAGKAPDSAGKAASFVRVVVQIALVDIIFSLDSVVTAIGMVEDLWVMVVAMVIAMFVMLAFSTFIADFVDKNPTIKVLALSFLILIGVLLVAEGLGQHIDKGYVYFAMAFAVGIELVNLRLRPTLPADADQLA
jgi:predicted tellurium resistance membrane protein TerC